MSAPPVLPDGFRYHDSIAGLVPTRCETIKRRFRRPNRTRAVELTAIGISGILDRARLAIAETLAGVPFELRREVLAEAQRRHSEIAEFEHEPPLVQVVPPAWLAAPSAPKAPKTAGRKLSLVRGGKPGPDDGDAP